MAQAAFDHSDAKVLDEWRGRHVQHREHEVVIDFEFLFDPCALSNRPVGFRSTGNQRHLAWFDFLDLAVRIDRQTTPLL